MLREVDIDEISDGMRYKSSDMVRISCNDCNGCSKCCHDMCDTIILDPYDIYMMAAATGDTFEALLEYAIRLRPADSLLLPHIAMQEETGACAFLSREGRCGIHRNRPGFCRLFPLGRIYENGGFSYFNQIYECEYPNKSKVKIKKWLDIPNLAAYEEFVIKWHDMQNVLRNIISSGGSDTPTKVNVIMLKYFYKMPYNLSESFYEQYDKRAESVMHEIN